MGDKKSYQLSAIGYQLFYIRNNMPIFLPRNFEVIQSETDRKIMAKTPKAQAIAGAVGMMYPMSA